jgi:hypothetical protein
VLPCILWCTVAGNYFVVSISCTVALIRLLATGVGSMYTLSRATGVEWSMYTLSRATAVEWSPAMSRWVGSFYATTLSTNLLSTLLLAYRIWSIDRRVTGVRLTKGPLRPVLSVVIDSGFLYLFTLVAALACFASENDGQNIVLDMVNPGSFPVEFD